MTITIAKCSNCGAPLGEHFCGPDETRAPCPQCNSMGRSYVQNTTEHIGILPSIRAKGFRGGLSRTKGWFIEIVTKIVPQRNRGGALAKEERVFKSARDGDRYTETITLCDTGEIINQCDEPLSAHRGHGDDKG